MTDSEISSYNSEVMNETPSIPDIVEPLLEHFIHVVLLRVSTLVPFILIQ